MSNAEVIDRERKRLPMAWKLFGTARSLHALPGILEPDEELLAVCPGARMSGDAYAGENYMVAASDRRLIALRLGALGAAKDHVSIPYDRLETFEADSNRERLEIAGDDVALLLGKVPREQLGDLEAAVRSRR